MIEYNFDAQQNENNFQRKTRLCIAKLNKEHDLDWAELINLLNLDCSADHLRKLSYAYKEMAEEQEAEDMKKTTIDTTNNKYKETTEILSDGSYKSDKLIAMSTEDSKDVDYLLEAHGFNTSDWELINARNNIWNVNTTAQGVQTLFSSKIGVKPKSVGFDMDKFLAKIEDINPKYIKQPVESTDRLLTLSFVDLHFGINSFDDYQQKLDETIDIIESKNWSSIYIPMGNDALHNNNHSGKTANGTQIETVDMDYATEEFYKFYAIILEKSLENSKSVVADYIPGNHDADITWMLVKMMAKMYPQVKWNTSMDAKKMFRWEDIFIVNIHGEKGLKRVAQTLITEYRDYMVKAKTVEIHSGHLHSERVMDNFGILVRTLPTSAKTDEWHKNMSFEGSMKASQLFEYDKEKLKNIHYV